MLVLLSPSETILDAENIWAGTLDTDLSVTGRYLAKDFVNSNTFLHPQRVYSSPASHVVEFTKIITPDIAPILIDEFADRSMGSLTGRTYRETMAEFPRRNWLEWKRSYWNAPPGGESFFDISDRVLTAFRVKVLPIPTTESVLVVCAPDVMRLLIGYIRRIEEPEVPKITIESAMPYVLNGDL